MKECLNNCNVELEAELAAELAAILLSSNGGSQRRKVGEPLYTCTVPISSFLHCSLYDQFDHSCTVLDGL